MISYRVDELAREAGTTVRNVRAYQDRGLLAPPRREGRVGVYSDGHLARLRLIGRLLERGYSLANIDELLSGWEQGQDLRQLLGLEAAITGPFSEEVPTWVTLADLVELFGAMAEPDLLLRAVDLGLLVHEGDERFRVPSPRLLHAGAELIAAGVPLEAVLDHLVALRRDVDTIAARFVDLVTTHVFGDDLPPEDVPRLADVVQRLRPLAEMVVDAELARALEETAHDRLGDSLVQLLAHLDEQQRSAS
jgi:DNA-binding transcriptional MerR regulator